MHWFLKFILGMKLYMFRTVPLSIIRSFSLYTQQWYMSYRFAESLRVGLEWNCSSSPVIRALFRDMIKGISCILVYVS